MNDKIRVIELFAGVGSQHQALKNLNIPHEVVGISEIDKYAVAAYESIHGKVNNLGDITKIDHLPDCDLVTYSFPCQDLSVAGTMKGMAEGCGTRSSLLWEVGRLLDDLGERGKLPEFLLMENVDAILNDQNKPHFLKWIIKLNELGYDSSYAVVNALDCGIPQNRNRCFMVSSLTKGCFRFPEKKPLELKLKDLLEDDPDDSCYLSAERLKDYEDLNAERLKKGKSKLFRLLNMDDDHSFTIMTRPDRSTANFLIVAGDLMTKGRLDQDNRVYSSEGCGPTIVAHGPPVIKEVE